jgi:hypothetical protein
VSNFLEQAQNNVGRKAKKKLLKQLKNNMFKYEDNDRRLYDTSIATKSALRFANQGFRRDQKHMYLKREKVKGELFAGGAVEVLENGNSCEIADAMKEPPICQCFLIYEREDRESAESPWFLKEFNFFHSHPLDLTKAMPKPWKEISKERAEVHGFDSD